MLIAKSGQLPLNLGVVALELRQLLQVTRSNPVELSLKLTERIRFEWALPIAELLAQRMHRDYGFFLASEGGFDQLYFGL